MMTEFSFLGELSLLGIVNPKSKSADSLLPLRPSKM